MKFQFPISSFARGLMNRDLREVIEGIESLVDRVGRGYPASVTSRVAISLVVYKGYFHVAATSTDPDGVERMLTQTEPDPLALGEDRAAKQKLAHLIHLGRALKKGR